MALEKTIADDRIEVVGDYKHIQVRTATIVSEDGVELSRSYHRRVISPEADITAESAEIQGIANAAWTDEIKTAWATLQAEQAAALNPAE
jgi:hypothetical protein